MVQQYHKLCTKLFLSVGNSLEAVVMPVACVPVYGSSHIHAVLYRVPARILSGTCSIILGFS